jgi:hypothetical protein
VIRLSVMVNPQVAVPLPDAIKNMATIEAIFALRHRTNGKFLSRSPVESFTKGPGWEIK